MSRKISSTSTDDVPAAKQFISSSCRNVGNRGMSLARWRTSGQCVEHRQVDAPWGSALEYNHQRAAPTTDVLHQLAQGFHGAATRRPPQPLQVRLAWPGRCSSNCCRHALTCLSPRCLRKTRRGHDAPRVNDASTELCDHSSARHLWIAR